MLIDRILNSLGLMRTSVHEKIVENDRKEHKKEVARLKTQLKGSQVRLRMLEIKAQDDTEKDRLNAENAYLRTKINKSEISEKHLKRFVEQMDKTIKNHIKNK